METLMIDRETSLEKLFSFVGAERIKVTKSGTGGVMFAAVADETEDAARAARRARRLAAFDKCRLDLTDFKFNRDEANDYD
jgi:uncharacterized metal-binding protein